MSDAVLGVVVGVGFGAGVERGMLDVGVRHG
jgi:hypothetical protein